jgi:hypothetical protein
MTAPCTGLLLRSNNAIRVWLAAGIFVACAAIADACFYADLAFKETEEEQADIESLLYERYENRRMDFYRGHLDDMKKEVAAKRGDLHFMDNYAYVLYHAGRAQEAEAIWRDILKKEPNRFTTLCNFATAAHQRGMLPEAYQMLKLAHEQKPEVRSGAEQWHLRYLDFLMKQRQNPQYAKDHLFIDELSPIWKAHTQPSKDFAKTVLPVAGAYQGVVELLRQYPRAADIWLVAALLLDHDKKYDLAHQAYTRAQKYGSGQNYVLKDFLPKYKEFQDKGSRIRAAGRGMVMLLGFVFLLVIYRYLGGLLMAIRSDRSEAKRRAEEEKKQIKRSRV